jgi:hypothetical protein
VHGLDRHRGRRVLNRAEVERAEGHVDEKNAEDEAPVADAVRNERLLAGVRRALLLAVMISRYDKAHALPAHEHHQEVAPQDEHEHEEAEEVQVAEESRDAGARLVGHVGRRVHVNHRADPGHDEDHHPGQRVEPESPRHLERPDGAVRGLERNRRNPLSHDHVERPRLGGQAEQLPEREHRHAEREVNHRTPPGRLSRRNGDAHEAVDRGPDAGSTGISQMYLMFSGHEGRDGLSGPSCPSLPSH